MRRRFQMWKRFNVSVEQIKDISGYTQEFVDKLLEESKRLESFASLADEKQMKSIADFRKAYEVILQYSIANILKIWIVGIYI